MDKQNNIGSINGAQVIIGDGGTATASDITINKYLEPRNYLEILEQAIQSNPKFSAASKRERESLLSKIKSLKNDSWVTSIGSAAIIEFGKKLFGFS